MNHPQAPSSDHKVKPSLLRRIPLALGALFSLLADADLAARYAALRNGAAPPIGSGNGRTGAGTAGTAGPCASES